MVKDKLIEILELRKETLSGEDISHIVDSIIKLDNHQINKETTEHDRKQQEVYKKMGKEYMFGGES